MPELISRRWQALRVHAGDFWHAARHPVRPYVAPSPERGAAPAWKWDRPLDLILGRAFAADRRRTAALLARAQAIADRSAAMDAWTDEDIDAAIAELRANLVRRGLRADLVDEAFALIREISGRALGKRHYPVQLMAGLVMLDGGLAEMATGEGKTITALLPSIAAALAGTPVHVFTTNDYLAQRDAEGLAPVIERFGLSCGLIIHDQENEVRRAAYQCDIVYGTNKEITFDYLRDQTALGARRGAGRRLVSALVGGGNRPLLMRGLHFALVDEADSIFIDEARTPLILSAEVPADDDGTFVTALELAGRLEEGRDYHLRSGDRSVDLTEAGRESVAQLAEGLPQPVWRIRQAREAMAAQAVAATRLFQRDRDYIVADGTVQIVDESTGRVMADRSWEAGLHQLIEAKEALELTGTRQTLARITYQRFFRRYRKLAGMTGTAKEIAGEVWADYGLRTTIIPRNRPDQREDRGHVLLRDAAAKWPMVAAEVQAIRMHEAGRPVLIGTRSVADSEAVSAALDQSGLPHRVLNARQDAEEAAIIAEAGWAGAITVATNMAGRGTDIELGEGVAGAGGLHVILTAWHETARTDRQLFGRAARQGDPGSCRAITALDDELYLHFAARAVRLAQSAVTEWPTEGRMADLLRRTAQAAAERRHAAIRRQTELSEERLRKSLAFVQSD